MDERQGLTKSGVKAQPPLGGSRLNHEPLRSDGGHRLTILRQKCSFAGCMVTRPVGAWLLSQVDSDRQGGLLLMSGHGQAFAFRTRLSHTPASDWDLSWFMFLRHPLVLGPALSSPFSFCPPPPPLTPSPPSSLSLSSSESNLLQFIFLRRPCVLSLSRSLSLSMHFGVLSVVVGLCSGSEIDDGTG